MLLKTISTFLLSVMCCTTVLAADHTVEVPESTALPPPDKNAHIPEPPSPDVRAYLLMDYASGRVLFGKNYDDQIDPASLTKMMTSYVIGQEIKQGHLHLSDTVVVSQNAWSKNYSDSSKMFIEVGKEIPVEMLNKGIIIASGNDACIAMATADWVKRKKQPSISVGRCAQLHKAGCELWNMECCNDPKEGGHPHSTDEETEPGKKEATCLGSPVAIPWG